MICGFQKSAPKNGKAIIKQFEIKAMLLQHEQVIMDLVPWGIPRIPWSINGWHPYQTYPGSNFAPPAVNSRRKKIHRMFGTENQMEHPPIHHHL